MGQVHEIDISGSQRLCRLPVLLLCALESLQSLVFTKCPSLPFPPPEVHARINYTLQSQQETRDHQLYWESFSMRKFPVPPARREHSQKQCQTCLRSKKLHSREVPLDFKCVTKHVTVTKGINAAKHNVCRPLASSAHFESTASYNTCWTASCPQNRLTYLDLCMTCQIAAHVTSNCCHDFHRCRWRHEADELLCGSFAKEDWISAEVIWCSLIRL
jgi:hypothetical protein